MNQRADYLNEVSLRPWFKATNKPLDLLTSGLFIRNVVVVCATRLLDIHYGKEGLHIWVCQIEIDLDRGFVKPRLNFV